MQGKVLDKTGKPISTTIFFENENGKRISSKSNISDGVYQAILTPGVNYTVFFKDYLEASGEIEINLPNVKSYTELNRSFTVSKIEEGLELMRTNVFKVNETTLTGPYAVYFGNLKSFMNTNLNVGIVLTIHTHDCSFKPKTLTESYTDAKNKKKTRKITVTVQQQAESLAQSRMAILKEYFIANKIPEKRITWSFDIKADAPKTTTKSKSKETKQPSVNQNPNIVVSVGRILKL
jgi:hypothetical protein